MARWCNLHYMESAICPCCDWFAGLLLPNPADDISKLGALRPSDSLKKMHAHFSQLRSCWHLWVVLQSPKHKEPTLCRVNDIEHHWTLVIIKEALPSCGQDGIKNVQDTIGQSLFGSYWFNAEVAYGYGALSKRRAPCLLQKAASSSRQCS